MASHKWETSSTERRSSSATQHINKNISGEDLGEDQDSLDIKPPQAKIMTTTTNYATTHHRDVGIGVYRSRNDKSDINRKHNNNNSNNNSHNNSSKHYRKSSISDKSMVANSSTHNNHNTSSSSNNMVSAGGGGSGSSRDRDRERESERLERKRDWRYDDGNISSSSSSRNISKVERRDAHVSSHRYPKYHEENLSSREEEYHYHHVHSSHSYHNNHYNHNIQNNQPYQQQQQQQHGTAAASSNYHNQQQQSQEANISRISSSSGSSKNALNHHNISSSRSLDDYAMNEIEMLELKAYANEKQQQQRKHRKIRQHDEKLRLSDEQTEHDLRSRLLSKRHKFMKNAHEDDDEHEHELEHDHEDELLEKQFKKQQKQQQQVSPDEHNNILELQRERILLRNLLKGTYSNNESHHHQQQQLLHDFPEQKDREREREKDRDKDREREKEKEKLKRLKRTDLAERANNKVITHVVNALSPSAVAASVTAGLKDLSTTAAAAVAAATITATTVNTTITTTTTAAELTAVSNTSNASQHKLSQSKRKSNNNNQSYEIVESLSEMETDAAPDGDDDDDDDVGVVEDKSEKNFILNEHNNSSNSKLKKQKKKKKKKKKRREQHNAEREEQSDMDVVRLDDGDDERKNAFVLSDDSNEEQLQEKLKQKQLKKLNNLQIEKLQLSTAGAATSVSICSENSLTASLSFASSSSSTAEEDEHDNNTNSSYTTPKTKHKHKKHQSHHHRHHQQQQLSPHNQHRPRERKRHRTVSLAASENSFASEEAYRTESARTSPAISNRSDSASSRCTHSTTESVASDVELKMKKSKKIEKSTTILIEEKSMQIVVEKNNDSVVAKEQQEVLHNLKAKCDNNNLIDADENLNLPNYFPGVQGCRSVEEFQCLNRIEEGTYGVVYRAKDKRTNEVVALKRLKMEKEKEGFPITSLREINTLLKGQHPNIVTVREIVVGSNMDKIFIVMDYVEHDLKSLMETMKQRKQNFLPSEVKCLIQQLLRAVAHLHDNWILHRDLKTSNLLLSHKGILKVGDFGLAREYGSPLKRYTLLVVTLWYRAPELLLCSPEYSTPIDMWSVGCIFAELLLMRPLFTGESEIDQLNRIFKELGTPNEDIWPGFKQLPAVKNLLSQNSQFTEFTASNLRKRFGDSVSDMGIQLLQGMLTYDPSKRLTAETALRHSYFTELPLPIDPSMFPTWPAKSELGARKASAASPKPPSGNRHFKRQEEKNLSKNQNKSTNSVATTSNAKILSGIITGNKKTASSTGFVLNAGIEQRQYTARSGFNSKF